jgi:hypothetical protein
MASSVFVGFSITGDLPLLARELMLLDFGATGLRFSRGLRVLLSQCPFRYEPGLFDFFLSRADCSAVFSGSERFVVRLSQAFLNGAYRLASDKSRADEGLIMKERLTVLASEIKTYKGKEGRPDGQFQILQCIVHGDKLLVGELRLFGDLAKEQIAPGDYEATFALSVDQKKEIGGRLVALARTGGVSFGAPADKKVEKSPA